MNWNGITVFVGVFRRVDRSAQAYNQPCNKLTTGGLDYYAGKQLAV